MNIKPSIINAWKKNPAAYYNQLFDRDNPKLIEEEPVDSPNNSSLAVIDQRNVIAVIGDTSFVMGGFAIQRMLEVGSRVEGSQTGLWTTDEGDSWVDFGMGQNVRLPDSGLHMVINSSDPSKSDLRDRLRDIVAGSIEVPPLSYGSPIDFEYPDSNKRVVRIYMPANDRFGLVNGVLQSFNVELMQ